MTRRLIAAILLALLAAASAAAAPLCLARCDVPAAHRPMSAPAPHCHHARGSQAAFAASTCPHSTSPCISAVRTEAQPVVLSATVVASPDNIATAPALTLSASRRHLPPLAALRPVTTILRI
jgi:hypothetical protein